MTTIERHLVTIKMQKYGITEGFLGFVSPSLMILMQFCINTFLRTGTNQLFSIPLTHG